MNTTPTDQPTPEKYDAARTTKLIEQADTIDRVLTKMNPDYGTSETLLVLRAVEAERSRLAAELTASQAQVASLALDKAQFLQRIEELELQVATGIPALATTATAAQAGKETKQ